MMWLYEVKFPPVSVQTEILTTPEPLFIHTMVREGFPVQAQLNTASDPRSTCKDWGSAAMRGPTIEKKKNISIHP